MLEIVKEEKKQKTERRIEIGYDKQRLISAIQIWFRKKEIPEEHVGTDLLRGTIYGAARHPERTIQEAISGSILYCNFPCVEKTVEAGLEMIWDLLSEILGYFEDSENCDKLQEVEKFVLNAVEEIRAEYCLELSHRVIEEEFKLAVSIIGSMLYKKLRDNTASIKEMCGYAAEVTTKDEKVMNRAIELIPLDTSMEDYIEKLVDRAYELGK